MKLIEVKLQGFRGYRNETSLSLDDLTVLVGRNDAGKSSVLDALNIFFNDAEIDRHDASAGGDMANVRICCVFEELPAQVILDEQHPTTLQAEHLVRADGKLEICRVFSCTAATGKPVKTFARAFHPTAPGCADLLSLKMSPLKARAAERQVNLDAVDETIKTQIRQAIWNQTPDLARQLVEVDLGAEAGKTAWEQIQLHLPVYALFKSDRASTDQDEEAQDPLKSAIKEAVRQSAAELEAVIGDVKAELEQVVEKTIEKIREMSPDLANTLDPQVKTKNWDSLFSVTLTGENGISINKRGSGTRRLVLLNFFRAKAEDASAKKAHGAIYAIEEPETSQHPNHQLMLLEAFQELTAQGAAQVILTTHTPTLARRVNRKSLRLVGVQNHHPVIHHGNDDATITAIKETLGVLADHDVKVFVGVEGKWDIEFLRRISKILHPNDATIPDLTVAEAAGHLVFVPLGGNSLDLWTNRLAGFGRPEMYLTDRDVMPPADPKYVVQMAEWNNRPHCNARCTGKRELENYLHPTVVQALVASFPAVIGDFDDVPAILAEHTHQAVAGAAPWAGLTDEKKKRKIGQAKKRLNTDCVDQMTAVQLGQSDPAGFVAAFLRDIGNHLV